MTDAVTFVLFLGFVLIGAVCAGRAFAKAGLGEVDRVITEFNETHPRPEK